MNTHLRWPQFTNPSLSRESLRDSNLKRVHEFFLANRPYHNMSEWLKGNAKISRQRLHQIETHQASVTQKTALSYAKIYGDDPLRIQLRTGECPPELAYTLGWELWDKFEEFLVSNLKD